MMEDDDDNIAKVQDDGKQKITGKFQRESDNTGTKPRTSQDRHKVLLSTVMRKKTSDKGRL